MPCFERISLLFQSTEEAVRAANVLDKAYADATNPEYHKPFGADNPQMVAMNLAGLYAADTAANLLALLNGHGTVSEEAYEAVLLRIAENQLSVVEKYVVKNCANLAWRSGQPFRDITSKPLGRITREVNAQFNTLPVDEQDKDLVQVITGARLILKAIEG